MDTYEPGPSPSPEYTDDDGHTLRTPPANSRAEKNRSTIVETADGARISPGDILHIDRLDETPYTVGGFYEVTDANLTFASLTIPDDTDAASVLVSSLDIHWQQLARRVDSNDITVDRNPAQ